MSLISPAWQRVRDALDTAVSIAWDGCHKIYVHMDLGQHEQSISLGYEPWLIGENQKEQAEQLLREWWEESCGLRFISSVTTVDGDPNEGFARLIAQGESEWPEEFKVRASIEQTTTEIFEVTLTAEDMDDLSLDPEVRDDQLRDLITDRYLNDDVESIDYAVTDRDVSDPYYIKED